MSQQNLIVIGNGMVGHHFLEQLAESGQAANFSVTVLGEERNIAYDRVHLSEYFQGKTADDLAFSTLEQYAEWGFDLRLNTRATSIDRQARTLTLDTGETLAYDKLVLATGSYPFVPPIPGNDREDCLVYRTIDDLDAIREAASRSNTGVVVGGGLLGLEAANALRELDLDTAVVEFAPRLMPVQVDEPGGNLLREKIEDLGVQVLTGRATQRIEDGNGARHQMVFQDDKLLETDMIVFSAGIRPRDELAREADLAMGERGGVVINDHCETSDPNILAIGEVALWNESIFGLVGPGYQMAKAALDTLTGGDRLFQGADMSTKLKLLGVDVGAIGDAHGDQNPGARFFRYTDEIRGEYRKLVVSGDGKQLLGAMLVGDNSYYDTLLQYASNGLELPDSPESLILPASEGGAPALGVDALPETAGICSCHNVSKGDIVQCVQEGASLGEVKTMTKATTGCGGCAGQVKEIVDHEMAALGIEVDNSVCEHFAYTRQELEHIIRVEGIHDFHALLKNHGKGLGCDICKPAVASILASTWNDYVLNPEHVGLQDTNDTFLANMQKDGTFSVVPRVAGGEITPDKLITLGEVAKEFQLYTKITGGQRVDLFGAKLNDLPAIWERLVDAGFETGHAYGKALRTVKSCVGSTWCRYGVQDSVQLAIDLEHRYKGIRAPHKIKFGVSGCTRECAEAQSKDFGVIATENGWNLYVAGNGGMRPRHADLLAQDLDTDTLIRTIDRFMMLYIRTADRLQRTARWLENLEGGLDYVYDVVVNDSLGIAEDLDNQMARLVENYQCEWKTTLEDPEKLKRFRQMINEDGDDPYVVTVEERGQPRPATDAEKLERIPAVTV
ncbi:assimilatory nitrite reductase (NAD(P)H) large subunit precursor [Halospina denitrificans]|uniref:Assimilatory nitrite reductase (NAD(P)H) large subunit n=1 Tax=Halospina denitrificans TaxID=332522 RepID=A0A4R7JQ47_9GAMM|nr:nitrite reductase large subunit NirB [Halospina denitrificans]TDT40240.1 assimilatory nitrite reductase (NAD(P)H) large subunit precursor [Halospina denitrificans]